MHSYFEKLIGYWKLIGADIQGFQKIQWVEGEYFLMSHFDILYAGRNIKGIEIYKECQSPDLYESQSFDNEANHFYYFHKVEGQQLTIWHGKPDSKNYFTGTFNNHFTEYKGSWKWPGGGYSLTATKTDNLL